MGRKPYFGLTGVKVNIAIGLLAGIDFLLFGYDQGVTGGLLNLPEFLHQFPEINYLALPENDPRRQTVSTQQGITVASYTLGAFFGAVATIWVGNWLGRRKTIFMGTSIMVIGATLQCSSFSIGQFIVGRLITGFGNGFNTSTVPTWQSETSKSNRRGQLVIVEGALIIAGVALSYWVDFGFSFITGSSVNWRFPIGFQIVFCLMILPFILSLPESPRWLILKGKEDEAIKVLAALSEKSADDPFIQNELLAIKDTVAEETSGSFRDLFTMDENRHFHRVALAYSSQMFQQLSGINLITYYAPNIYRSSLGLTPLVSGLLASFNGTEYFLASLIPIFIIEKVGRRKVLLVGAAGQAMAMAVLAISTAFPGNKSAGVVAALFLFVFNTFFGCGWLGVPWLYPAEVVPLRIRAPANAISTSANWIFNFLVVMITPPSFDSIHYRTYIIFAVFNAIMIPSVYFFYPETSYRSLEEMDTIFHKTTSFFDVVRVAAEEPHRYDKKGNILVSYEETDEHRRRSSITHQPERRLSARPNDEEKARAMSHVEQVRL